MEKQLPLCLYSFILAAAQGRAAHPVRAPETMKPMLSYQNLEEEEEEEDCQDERSEVSTELTLCCEFQSITKKHKTSETSSSASTSVEKVLVPLVNAAKHDELLKNQWPEEEVSTALKLYDESWTSKKRKTVTDSTQNFNFSPNSTKHEKPFSHFPCTVAFVMGSNSNNIPRMKKDEQKGRRLGAFSTRLPDQDPWKIKKRLTDSDLGHLSRLLVRTYLVKNHVLPFLGGDCTREVKSKGMQVIVWDQDTKSGHELVFKQWPTSKSYVFIGMWHQDFVVRRDLKQGDVIGLYWDSYNSMFIFCVLERAIQVNQSAI